MNFKNILFAVTISVITAGVTVYLIDKKDIELVKESVGTPVSFVSNSRNNMSPSNFTKAAESTVNAVVHVTNVMEGSQRRRSDLDFFWGGGSQQRSQPMVGSGSGVIITQDGYIVTNNHVIEKSQSIEVTLNNQKRYTAKIIGTDPKTDIALLKIEADKLPNITLSDSDNIRLGEWVLAVGNPFNLTSTVTAGIISAIGRDIRLLGQSGIESFIQTDAAVNPGNSGGALVNTNGDLIGINTAISTHTGSFEGYSFAVPSNIVKKVVEDLIEYGQVQRAYLGINIHELNNEAAKRLEVKDTEGIYISGFSDSGFASESGLAIGDVIYKIDNKNIKTFADLRGYLASKRPGDDVNVKVKRGGNKETLRVKLTNSYGTTELNKLEEKDVLEMLNADFKPLSDKEKYQLGVRAGVKVLNIGDGLLRKAGIKDGFIILIINKQWVRSKEDIERIISGNDKAVLMEVVNNEGYVDYYAVKM
ncbi:MAG: trypsin-like peptidase domain-containing protein [Bacteroidota bacterium]